MSFWRFFLFRWGCGDCVGGFGGGWCWCWYECERGLVSRVKDGVPSGSLADSEPAACSVGGRRPRGILVRGANTRNCDGRLAMRSSCFSCGMRNPTMCLCLLPRPDMSCAWKRRAVKEKLRCECSFPLQTRKKPALTSTSCLLARPVFTFSFTLALHPASTLPVRLAISPCRGPSVPALWKLSNR